MQQVVQEKINAWVTFCKVSSNDFRQKDIKAHGITITTIMKHRKNLNILLKVLVDQKKCDFLSKKGVEDNKINLLQQWIFFNVKYSPEICSFAGNLFK